MGDLEQRVADTIEIWADCSRSVALGAARAIIPMVLEEAAKVAECAEAPFDEHRECPECHGFYTAADQIATAIRAIGAP